MSMAEHLAVPNIIASVFTFFRLRMSSFSLNHSANKFKPSDSIKCDSIISMSLPATYNTVSSAYLMMREFLRTSNILFAKIENNKRPKIDPYGGTPQVTKADSDKVLL